MHDVVTKPTGAGEGVRGPRRGPRGWPYGSRRLRRMLERVLNDLCVLFLLP